MDLIQLKTIIQRAQEVNYCPEVREYLLAAHSIITQMEQEEKAKGLPLVNITHFNESEKWEQAYKLINSLDYNQKQKIPAIKTLREQFPGMSLACALRIIESFVRVNDFVAQNGILPISLNMDQLNWNRTK